MPRIPALDGVRAIAIAAVLVFHLPYGLLSGGFLGVDLFFVLSGFLITSVLHNDPGIRRFYQRRALRIFPPLLVSVAVAAALSPTHPAAIGASLFFVGNLLPWSVMGSLSHLWSLAIEEHFYLAWPFAFVRAGRWRTRGLCAVVVASLFLRLCAIVWGVEHEWLYKLTIFRADSLALGCLTALHWRRLGSGGTPAALSCLVLVVASFVMLEWPNFWLASFGFTAFAVACAVFIASILVAREGSVSSLLSFRWVTYIGRRSYGLYLFHWPVYSALDASGTLADSPWVSTFAKLCVTLGLAEVSFRTVERAADGVKRAMDRAAPAADATDA